MCSVIIFHLYSQSFFLISHGNCYILCSLCLFLCTCRCQPAKGESTLCNFIHSPTNYHIVVSNESDVILQALSQHTQTNSNKCNQFSAFFICLYLFRSCKLHNVSDPSSAVQLSVCQNKCPAIFKLSDECVDRMTVQTLLNSSGALHTFIDWALNFSCYDPTSYAVPQVPISDTCDNISFIDALLLSPGDIIKMLWLHMLLYIKLL